MGLTSLSQVPHPHAVPQGRCQHSAPLLKQHNTIFWYCLVKLLFQPFMLSSSSHPSVCYVRNMGIGLGGGSAVQL